MKQVYSSIVQNESQLSAEVTNIEKIIRKKSIILLMGELAAGKTTFVINFCNLFGLTSVQSPTYSIHQRYSNALIAIDHFDLYRLTDEDELVSSGFFDLLNLSADYKFIEWPERIKIEDLPLDKRVYKLIIKKTEGTSRKFELYELS